MRLTPLILDFDSTLVQHETLDVLGSYLMDQGRLSVETTQTLSLLTTRAMAGDLSFSQALQQRLALLSFTRKDLAVVTQSLALAITPSFLAHQHWLALNAEDIYIVSGGFLDVIRPIATKLGLRPDHIFANTLIFDAHDQFVAVDDTQPLAHEQGKANVVSRLGLSQLPLVIGDGATDAEIREAGFASAFYLFTENVFRENLLARADKVIASFDAFLYSS